MGAIHSRRGRRIIAAGVVVGALIAFSILASLLLPGAGTQPSGAPSLRLQTSITLPPAQGRLDHMDVDLAGGRLFVVALANDTLYVASLSTGQVTARIPGLSTPQGVLYDANSNQIFVSNGGNGTVQVFDGDTYSRKATIPLGVDADNMRLESNSDRVLVGYGWGGSSGIAVIDAATDRVVTRFGLDGHPEAFQLDVAAGLLFVNVPTAQEVEVVNYTSGGLYARWALPTGAENYAMALNPQRTRLFIGTRVDSSLMTLDASTGTQVDRVTIPGGVDDIFYDAPSGTVVASCSDGVLELLQEGASGAYRVVSNVTTGVGAGTSLLVPQTRTLYVAVPSSSGSPATILVYQFTDATSGSSGLAAISPTRPPAPFPGGEAPA